MSAFDDDFASAEDLLDEIFGGSVTLRRGVTSTASFVAPWDLQEYELTDDRGVVTVFQSRDYLLLKTSVVIAAAQVTPRAGDRIHDSGDVYELLPIGDRPAVEDVAGGTRWLAHTKKVAA